MLVSKCALLFLLSSLCWVARGQQVLPPPPRYSVAPTVLIPYLTNEADVFTPPELAAQIAQQEAPPIRLGPLNLWPHLFYRFDYGTGIPAAGTNHIKTTIQELSPGLLLGLGTHWTLDYTPTWRFYSSSQFKDTLDHNVVFAGGANYADWLLGLSQAYVSSSTPLVETGVQTDQQTYTTTAKATHRFNTEMWTDLALRQDIMYADQFASHREWSTLDWLNYDFWQRLTAGIGIGGGYVNMLQGADSAYGQAEARAAWRATDKLSFQAHGGVEIREFRGSAGTNGTLVSPVASGTVEYKPFDVTTLSVSANHAVAVSYFENQVTETTEVVGGLNQRLLGKLFLDLSGGYHRVEYIAADASFTGRKDKYYTFASKLSCSFLKHGTLAVFYLYTDNSSTAPGFTFSGNQVGFEAGYRF